MALNITHLAGSTTNPHYQLEKTTATTFKKRTVHHSCYLLSATRRNQRQEVQQPRTKHCRYDGTLFPTTVLQLATASLCCRAYPQHPNTPFHSQPTRATNSPECSTHACTVVASRKPATGSQWLLGTKHSTRTKNYFLEPFSFSLPDAASAAALFTYLPMAALVCQMRIVPIWPAASLIRWPISLLISSTLCLLSVKA